MLWKSQEQSVSTIWEATCFLGGEEGYTCLLITFAHCAKTVKRFLENYYMCTIISLQAHRFISVTIFCQRTITSFSPESHGAKPGSGHKRVGWIKGVVRNQRIGKQLREGATPTVKGLIRILLQYPFLWLSEIIFLKDLRWQSYGTLLC